ncbi:MAG: hypothetical protein ACI9I0_002216, partial [Rhodoferax sp.]
RTGQKPPLTACAQQVQHCAEHLIQVYRRGLGAPANALQQGQNFFKLLLSDVAGVSLSRHGIFGSKG